MKRREYLRTAAVLLGTGVAAAGRGAADSDDDWYDVAIETFEDVTMFREPKSKEHHHRRYVRLYDAEAETLAYATTVGTDEVVLALRDASDVDLAG
jgi:3-dehydroquinate synthase class II